MLALVKKAHAQWRLSTQVTILMMLTLGITGLFAFIYLDHEKNKQITLTVDQQTTTAVSILSSVVFEGIISEDIDMLETGVQEAYRGNKAILSISVYNEEGQILATWPQNPKQSTMSITQMQNIEASGETFGKVEINWDTQPIVASVSQNTQSILLLIIGFISLVGMLFITLIRGIVIRPVNKVYQYLHQSTDITNDINNTQSVHKNIVLPAVMPPELTQFSALTKELRNKQAQLIQSAKLASIGELASGVGHELNNPLLVVSMNIEVLQSIVENNTSISSEDRTDINDLLNTSLNHCQRMESIINRLGEIYKKADGKFSSIDIKTVIEESLLFMNHTLQLDNINIELSLHEEDITISGNTNKLKQVFINLVKNAHESLVMSPTDVSCQISISSTIDKDWIIIALKDNGPGITEEIQNKIFNPFFTTKQASKSTGLGLSISHAIIQQHSGSINYRPTQKQGAEFIIKLPMEKLQT